MHLLVILLVSFSVWSQTATEITKTQEKLSFVDQEKIRLKYIEGKASDIETAVKLLKLDLAPFVKTLDRDITTFNYRESSYLKFDQDEARRKDNPKAIAYAKEWADAAKKHLPDESGMLGWGLYTSNNPQSSEDYGGSDPALVTLKYPKNSKMLDVRKVHPSKIPLSTTTLKYLNNLCDFSIAGSGSSTYAEGMIYSYVHKTHLVQNPKCHEVYIKAMEGLGVTGIIYDWGFASSSFCDGGINGAAFVSFGSELSDQTIDLYSKLPDETYNAMIAWSQETDTKKKEVLRKKLGMNDTELRAYEKMATVTSPDAFTMKKYGIATSLKAFAPEEKKKQEYVEEWRKELFGCDQKYKEQDAPHYNPNQALEVLLKDGIMSMDLGKELNEAIRSCVGE